MNSGLIAGALVLVLAGCNDFQPHFKQSPHGGEYVISTSASLRPGIVFQRGGKEWVCMPPPPDAGFREADDFELSISIASVSTGDEAADAASVSGEQEFVGRTPALLLARELFFQQCIASFNMELSKAETLALYNQNLDIISKIFAAETANTTLSIQQTLTDADQDTDSDATSVTSGKAGG